MCQIKKLHSLSQGVKQIKKNRRSVRQKIDLYKIWAPHWFWLPVCAGLSSAAESTRFLGTCCFQLEETGGYFSIPDR